MVKKLLFILLVCGFGSYAQSCYSPELWNEPDGYDFRAMALASIKKPCGVITDSLYVRKTGTFGVLGTIAPLRTHFSVTTTGSGPASYNQNTGVFNIPNNSVKMSVPYTGTTNGSGVYTITYPVAYASTPNVQAIFQTSDPRDVKVEKTSVNQSVCWNSLRK